jgi:hypothetical protein
MAMATPSANVVVLSVVAAAGCGFRLVPEPGDAAVGYLTSAAHDAEICTVTLIAHDTAITAAHCIDPEKFSNASGAAHVNDYRVGFGPFAAGDSHTIKKIFLHPGYHGLVGVHDLAVIMLFDPVEIAPMRIAAASSDTVARVVSYGRALPGAVMRSSSTEAILAVGPLTLRARGSSGGTCYGDSGAPLLADGTMELYGVVSGFAEEPYDCQVDTHLVSALSSEGAFLARATACSDSPDPDCMIAPSFETAAWRLP